MKKILAFIAIMAMCSCATIMRDNTQPISLNSSPENVNIKINGRDYQVPEGITILEAAKMVNIHIPTLCFLKEINEIGACRMCVVEVKGAKALVTSCVYPVNEGMEIQTASPKVLESRIRNLELLLSDHRRECLSCVRSGHCELQELAQEYGIKDEHL